MQRNATDIADDDLNTIFAIKHEAHLLIQVIERFSKNGTLNISAKDLNDAASSIDEALNDLLFKDFNLLKGISGSVTIPEYMPNYADFVANSYKRKVI